MNQILWPELKELVNTSIVFVFVAETVHDLSSEIEGSIG